MYFPPPQLQEPLSPGRQVHCLTRSEFLDRHLVADEASATKFTDSILPVIWDELAQQVAADRPRIVLADDGDLASRGYHLVLLLPHQYEPAVVVAIAPDGTVVGAARLSMGLAVKEDHRGQGIATELMLAAFATGVKDVDRPFPLSPGGFATMSRVHRHAVERAVRSGVDVPDRVLDDYPDIAFESARPAF